ncbi:class F sortase [Candidatus Saccharibacteria bacterium]|jgi:LPXTG-site transpeptidase (sortase) family protein|nr:class F sortase [Candidatus Saccharibacteria bacterium]
MKKITLAKPSPRIKRFVQSVVFLALIVVGFTAFSATRSNNRVVNVISSNILGGSNAGGFASEEPPADPLDQYSVPADMPRLISIPSIDVKARIKTVGLTNEGAIDVPSNIFDVGWYNGSARPGSSGAAFVDGHVSGPTQNGVFYDLKKLKPGDKIMIEMGDKRVISYTVTSTIRTSKEEVDMASALSPVIAGKNGLNLITCAGKYNPEQQSFQDRVIVYTQQD